MKRDNELEREIRRLDREVKALRQDNDDLKLYLKDARNKLIAAQIEIRLLHMELEREKG